MSWLALAAVAAVFVAGLLSSRDEPSRAASPGAAPTAGARPHVVATPPGEAELEATRAILARLAGVVAMWDPDIAPDGELLGSLGQDELTRIRLTPVDWQQLDDAVSALELIAEDPALEGVAAALLEEDPWRYAGRVEQSVLDAAAGRRPAQAPYPTATPDRTPVVALPLVPTPFPLPARDFAANAAGVQPTPGTDANELFPDEKTYGLWTPRYPWSIDACNRSLGGGATARSNEVAGPIINSIAAALNIASAIADGFCSLDASIFGNEAKLATCAPWLAIELLLVPLNIIQNELDRCDASIDGAEIQATYQNTQRLLYRLRTHELQMIQADYTSDVQRQDAQGFQERVWIEQQLASGSGPGSVMLALPATACIDPPGVPAVIDGVQRARCGLLEQVRIVVEQTISMVEEAGESSNNAQREYEAARAHHEAREYRDAYRRYRNAYLEAVSARGLR